jgi:hypothetical protein
LLLYSILLLSFIAGCNNNPEPEPIPDPDPAATITLDELTDMETYTEGMIVDSRFYKNKRTVAILLNHTEISSPVSLDLTMPGYYRIEILTGDVRVRAEGVIRLVVLDPERGLAEWGLAPWTPAGVECGTIGSEEISMCYPRAVPAGSIFPLVVFAGGEPAGSLVNLEASTGSGSFRIKRGAGSAWVSHEDTVMQIDHRTFPVKTSLLEGPPLELSGVLQADIVVPAGSYLNIPGDLTIPAGVTLSLEPGTFVSIDPGVDLYNEGTLLIHGTEFSPVTLTCSDPGDYWGGVIGRTGGNRVEATYTICSRSGFHTGNEYDWGHAHRQALFYCEDGSVYLDHCFMTDHIGQVLYTERATVEMDHCLVQRVKTGGQLNGSRVTVARSVFTDFPDESSLYQDEDNDGLYMIECVAVISHSVFMYAKDDGLDSGGGGLGGDVTVTYTRFESNFHEGAALSGGSGTAKNQRFYNCVFQDCGQGLELGFSSSMHQVDVDSCLFYRNGIGIRYGDNYVYSNNGYMTVSNSQSLENVDYDVWNMDREDWVADTFHMAFSNVWVTKPNPMYPELKILE